VARLTRDDILEAWTRLGRLAHAEDSSIELIVVGGAVMAVYFQSRASTADVDAIFSPTAETRRWAEAVADELGLPSDWLNDGVKGFIAVESPGRVLHRSDGITVRTLALAHLLALKLMAWRDDVDFADAMKILEELVAEAVLDCSTPEKLLALVAPYFVPSKRTKAQYALEELWELHDPARADRS
jgi:predicted nucleotidyltransferase